MKIHKGLDSIQPIRNAVVTIGTFDGVHIGHQEILQRLKEIASKSNGETVVVTFWPHPRLVLFPNDDSLKLLSTFEEKAEILLKLGIDHLVAIPFTKEFSNLTSEQFTRQVLLEKIGTKRLVIGYDHRFGKNREGSFEHLKANEKEYGFKVEEISKQEIDNIAVSSTKIRKALETGDVKTANSYLGQHYSLSGKVVEGNRIGRTIGFPTANIDIAEKFKLVPADGVYAVKVSLAEGIFQGMLNIGNRPTIGDAKRSIECNIFDFSADIYNSSIKVELIERVRAELKFENVEQLKKQLEQDQILVKSFLKPYF
ncbi:bifunctional riboflavin kinase/FAD synthetase [Peijinzhouia sedimentorum]